MTHTVYLPGVHANPTPAQLVIDRLNTYRAQPLARSRALDMAAIEWAEELVAMAEITHGDWVERVRRHCPACGAIGENIAAGYDSAEAAVTAWMASPGHRANMLNPAYTHVGVGYAPGGYYQHYWVMDLGAMT